MTRNFASRKSGFSLIELAIVLIIIGILIAGVTGGAALIKSAELRSVVTEARGNSVSASAFLSLYDSLPGDSATYKGYSSGAVGNGDGKIEFCASNTCTTGTTTFAGSEGGAIAWGMLTSAGVVNIPNYVGVASNAALSSTSILPSKIKQTGWVYEYDSTNTVNVAILVPYGTYATGTDLTASGTHAYNIFLAKDAFAIDAKNDDGLPTTGRIKGYAGTTATDCIASSEYAVTITTKACTVAFNLDLGNG